MLEELKKHIEETPEEKLKQEWEKVEQYANIGPTIDEFIEHLKLNEN